MVSYIVSRIIIVGLGTLYPAYRSCKAIKSKNTKEYVKWMMYWIVFAIFTTAEIFIDTLIGFWFPFYYEVKIIFVLWLLSPTTKGSSILYKKFVHPFFTHHEKDIDGYIETAKENGYVKLVQYGKKGLDLAADTMMKTAISGQDVLVQQLRRYRSDGSLDQLGRDDHGIPNGNISDELTELANAEQRGTKRHPESITSSTESSTSRPQDENKASSLDDIQNHMRSSMTSSNSLMYDSNTMPRRYYDATDGSRRGRPTSYHEGSSTLPRYSSTTYDYSSRPYESSNLPGSSDVNMLTTSYSRYESSTLPRSRESSRHYNTRSSRTGQY